MNREFSPSIFFSALAQCLRDNDIYKDVPESNLHDWSDEVPGSPLCMVTPRNTEEVTDVVKLCAKYNVPVVPQGGLSGLSGGAVPSNGCLLLSLSKMNQIESIDTTTGTMQVQAGVILQTIQEKAEDAGWMFALDLGARGSCQIGGAISTNAGGNRVIRYGLTRDLVLGLEVVLANGDVLNMLKSMKKNNTGLDLRQIFIGTEGTLGIITRAIIKLHPGVRGANTALIACNSFSNLLSFLKSAQSVFSGRVSAFEVMWPDYYQFALKTLNRNDSFEEEHAYYLLFDVQSFNPEEEYVQFEKLMETAFEEGCIENALIAKSEREVEELWELRDCVSEILSINAPTINFDVSVGIEKIGDFAAQLKESLNDQFPDIKTLFFGHIGDSNLHLVAGPVTGGKQMEHAIESIVYSITQAFNGSISAEHGIGLHKKPWLSYSRSSLELDVMKKIRNALDPNSLMNPGKILD